MHPFDLVGEEGDRVGWRDGLRAEGDKVGVVGGGEGVDGFGGGEGLLAQGYGFAALCGVEDEDTAGKGGDADVAGGPQWPRLDGGCCRGRWRGAGGGRRRGGSRQGRGMGSQAVMDSGVERFRLAANLEGSHVL